MLARTGKRNRRLSLLGELNKEFDMFGNLLDAFSNSMGSPTVAGIKAADFVPALEVKETTDKYEVIAELPGVSAEDVDISLNDDTLIIKGEKKFCTEEKDEKSEVHFREISYGAFRRELTIPKNVDVEKIDATNKDGRFIINIPKIPEEVPKVKKITINTS